MDTCRGSRADCALTANDDRLSTTASQRTYSSAHQKQDHSVGTEIINMEQRRNERMAERVRPKKRPHLWEGSLHPQSNDGLIGAMKRQLTVQTCRMSTRDEGGSTFQEKIP